MKIKKILIFITALISLVAVGSTTTTAVQAKEEKINVKVFPKKMRGTWYQYDKGQLTKTIYTKKKIISYYNGKRGVLYLHVQPKGGSNRDKRDSKKENWVFLNPTLTKFQGHKWVTYWNWYACHAAPYFNVSRLNGHQVLTNEYGVYPNGANHSYRSIKLAKKLKNKRYVHFVY